MRAPRLGLWGKDGLRGEVITWSSGRAGWVWGLVRRVGGGEERCVWMHRMDAAQEEGMARGGAMQYLVKEGDGDRERMRG